MPRPAEQARALAQRYAPILVLHPEDPWPPIDGLAFVSACELWFGDDGQESRVAARGSVAPERLGALAAGTAYTHAARGLSAPVSGWQFSRPFDKNKARIAGLDERSGFFLRLTADPPASPLGDVPILYEWRDDATLIYWFCMAGSSLPDAVLGAIEDALGIAIPGAAPPAQTAPGTAADALEILHGLVASGAGPALGSEAKDARDVLAGVDRVTEVHEGDWEGMTVRFTGDQPTSVELHQHGRAAPLPLSALAHEGDRPIVYCARGTHATVGTPATAGAEEVAADGPRWAPGPERILDVTTQPYYGFGGAWGRRRRPPLGDLDETLRTLVRWVSGYDVWEEATGPLGPSVYKLR